MAHNNLYEDKVNLPDQVFEVSNIAAEDHHFGSVELQSIYNENITNLSGYVAQAIRRKFKDEKSLLHVASEHLYVAFVTKVPDLVGKIKTFVAELIGRISHPPCVLRVRANLLNRLQIIDLMKNFGHDVSVTMEGTCPEPDDDQKLYGSSARVFLRPKSALPKIIHYKSDGKLRQLEVVIVPPKPKTVTPQRRSSSDGWSRARNRRRHGSGHRDQKQLKQSQQPKRREDEKKSHQPNNREEDNEIRRQLEAAERRRRERHVNLAQEQLRQMAERVGRTAAAQAAAKAKRVTSSPDFSHAISRASASEQSRRQSSLTLAFELDLEEMPLTQPDASSSPPSRPRNANLSPLLPRPGTPNDHAMLASLAAQSSSHHFDAPNAGSSDNGSASG
jgi:hypothetical protein